MLSPASPNRASNRRVTRSAAKQQQQRGRSTSPMILVTRTNTAQSSASTQQPQQPVLVIQSANESTFSRRLFREWAATSVHKEITGAMVRTFILRVLLALLGLFFMLSCLSLSPSANNSIASDNPQSSSMHEQSSRPSVNIESNLESSGKITEKENVRSFDAADAKKLAELEERVKDLSKNQAIVEATVREAVQTFPKEAEKTSKTRLVQLETALQELEQTYANRLNKVEDSIVTISELLSATAQTNRIRENILGEIEDVIRRSLALRDEDDVGRPDYALASLGASVLRTETSPTYYSSTESSLTSLLLGKSPRPPEEAITAGRDLGSCWPCKVGACRLAVRLAERILLDSVSLEHPAQSLSVTPKNQDSAPKSFTVSAKGEVIGRFEYRRVHPVVQTFILPKPVVTDRVTLQVDNTHGPEAEFACIYRFRAHGKPV